MPFVAAKRLRWGDGFIDIGEPVPDNEPGRRYDFMVRSGEIIPAPPKAETETAVALVLQQPIDTGPSDASNTDSVKSDSGSEKTDATSTLPPINLDTATKRDLMAWIATVTGKEPGPASKEETLRARVAEILAGHVPTIASDQGEQGGVSQSTEQDRQPEEQPEQRLSQGATSAPVLTPGDPDIRTA